MNWPWRRPDRAAEVRAGLAEIQEETRRLARQLLRAQARWEAMEQALSQMHADLRLLAERPAPPADPEGSLLRLVLPVLDAVDGLERAARALAAAPVTSAAEGAVGAERQGLLDLLGRVHGLVLRALGQAGVEALPGEGSVFDPRLHRAVGRADAPGRGGQVLAVDRRGYTLEGRVLRFAEVVVGVEPAGVAAADAPRAGAQETY